MTDFCSPSSLAELTRQLIAIPSVNPSLAPKEGQGEAAIAKFVCDWLSARGVKAWQEEVQPGRVNAVAEIGGGAGPSLMFCAHLDTVSTAGMTIPPFEGRCEDGRIYGRGAYDMKGSIAAILAAAADLAQSRFDGRVLLALVADEEYASIGADHFVSRHSADACILTEPTDGKLILGHKGFVWAEIVTTGRAVHGSRWDLGVSAIEKMAPVITALNEFDRKVLRSRVDRLVGPASMHCPMIEGGAGLSTYAGECKLSIERRTLPGETVADVERELRGVIRSSGEEASVRCWFDRQPSQCRPDAPIACAVRSAVADLTQAAPVEAGVPYWMDAAIFSAAGIPTVTYGPTGVGAHEPVEWVDVGSVATCARMLVKAGRNFSERGADRGSLA